jgi:hypothetical protein
VVFSDDLSRRRAGDSVYDVASGEKIASLGGDFPYVGAELAVSTTVHVVVARRDAATCAGVMTIGPPVDGDGDSPQLGPPRGRCVRACGPQ